MASPTRPPAPPATGKPAPPSKERPPPPRGKSTSAADETIDKALVLEEEGKFQEAAIHYQERGDLSSATRCLNLALANKGDTTINIEQVGSRVIQDSVIMSDD